MKSSNMLRLIGLVLALFFMQGCSFSQTKKIVPNEIGSREERIEFHKAQIERYKGVLQKEEEELSKALTEQRMNDIRSLNLKKERYLIRLEQHMNKLKELMEMPG